MSVRLVRRPNTHANSTPPNVFLLSGISTKALRLDLHPLEILYSEPFADPSLLSNFLFEARKALSVESIGDIGCITHIKPVKIVQLEESKMSNHNEDQQPDLIVTRLESTFQSGERSPMVLRKTNKKKLVIENAWSFFWMTHTAGSALALLFFFANAPLEKIVVAYLSPAIVFSLPAAEATRRKINE